MGAIKNLVIEVMDARRNGDTKTLAALLVEYKKNGGDVAALLQAVKECEGENDG